VAVAVVGGLLVKVVLEILQVLVHLKETPAVLDFLEVMSAPVVAVVLVR
jgi:hypothetical protein